MEEKKMPPFSTGDKVYYQHPVTDRNKNEVSHYEKRIGVIFRTWEDSGVWRCEISKGDDEPVVIKMSFVIKVFDPEEHKD